MTTITGSFTSAGVSSALSLGNQEERIAFSVGGTFSGVWQVEQSVTPQGEAWEIIDGPNTSTAAGAFSAPPKARVRIRCVSRASGTLTYSLADEDAIVETVWDADGNPVMTVRQGGVVVQGYVQASSMDVDTLSAETFVFPDNLTLAGTLSAVSIHTDTFTTDTFTFDNDLNLLGTLSVAGLSTLGSVLATGDVTVEGTTTLSGPAIVEDLTATRATIAGVEHAPGILSPGWARLWLDPNGYAAGGIRDDGTLSFKTVGVTDPGTPSEDSGSFAAVSSLLPTIMSETTDPSGYAAAAIDKSGATLFTPRINHVAKASRNIVKPTLLHSTTAPRTGQDDVLASDSTIASLWSLDLDFDYIRIVLGQQSTNSITAKASVAVTAEANDGVNPLDELGDPGVWTDLTFNNAGSPDFQPWNQNSGSTSTIVQNTSAEDQVWGLTFSDWAQVSSLPRTDGSKYPLVMVRVHLTGSPVAVTMSSSNLFGLTPTISNYGKTWAGYVASGDYVGSKAGYPNSGTSYGNRWAPLFIQTYSRKLGYQLWGCGDSNMAGTGSTNGFMGFFRRSGLRVGRDFPVVISNFNQPGSSPSIFMANVENIIDAVKPSAVVIFPFSYNTPATMAILNTNWARALNIANRVSAYGGEPIFVGYPPRDSATADNDTVRRIGLARLAYAAQSGFRTVDPNVYVGTSDVPAEWVSGMSDDGIHFSNKGHAVTADLLSVQLAEAFGI
jgi:hypothetical protein